MACLSNSTANRLFKRMHSSWSVSVSISHLVSLQINVTDVQTAISLFQFCIETFGKIQIARSFKNDAQRCLMKLQVIQLRLSRRGEVANIATIDSTIQDETRTQEILDQVKSALGEMHNNLKKAVKDAAGSSEGLSDDDKHILEWDDKSLPFRFREILEKFSKCVQGRKAAANRTIEGVKWAFYKKEAFNAFAADMTDLLDELEEIVPGDDHGRLQDLSREECNGLTPSNLNSLKDMIEGCDPWLAKAVEENPTQPPSAGHRITQNGNKSSNVVGIHHGNVTSPQFGTTNNFGRT